MNKGVEGRGHSVKQRSRKDQESLFKKQVSWATSRGDATGASRRDAIDLSAGGDRRRHGVGSSDGRRA